MALFKWQCQSCGLVTKCFLESRPVLTACRPCGGKLKFLTNVGSQSVETIDNGAMAKVLERPVDIENKIAERIALAEQKDDPII